MLTLTCHESRKTAPGLEENGRSEGKRKPWGRGGREEGSGEDYLNIPYLRFVRRSAGQWLPGWQAGHVAGTSYTSNQPPMEATPIAPKAGAANTLHSIFTLYWPRCMRLFLTYSPDIGCWHVLSLTRSIFILPSWQWFLKRRLKRHDPIVANSLLAINRWMNDTTFQGNI